MINDVEIDVQENEMDFSLGETKDINVYHYQMCYTFVKLSMNSPTGVIFAQDAKNFTVHSDRIIKTEIHRHDGALIATEPNKCAFLDLAEGEYSFLVNTIDS